MELLHSIIRHTSAFFRLVAASSLFAALWLPATLESRTLTSKDGRTIEVEILSYEGDDIRLKRVDTGQVFTLPISTFSDADQRALRTEAKEAASRPKPVPAGSVQLELSRGMFSSEKRDSTGVVYTYEQWGYNIVINNRSGPPLENIRAEYILLMEPNPYHTAPSDRNKLIRTTGTANLEPLQTGARTQFRTSTVEVVKVALKDGWVWTDADRKRTTRDKLYGLWVRVFRGDELIAEATTPAGIVQREKW
jgi:hypothetical protein